MISEIWSIEYDEIVSFIMSLGGAMLNKEEFSYNNATIKIKQLQDKKLGPLFFPQNQLTISGDINDVNDFHTKFKLKYLKAGG